LLAKHPLASENPSTRGADTMDRCLFKVWKAGSRTARNVIWEELWRRLYGPVAVGYCRSFAGDNTTAQDWATDAFNNAFLEIDKKVRACQVEWQGEAAFVSFFRRRLIHRCQDVIKRELRYQGRIVPLNSEGEDESD